MAGREPLERAALQPRLLAQMHGPGGSGTVEGIDHRLMASWRRSQDYGVPLDDVDPLFTGSYDTESLFFECGQEVLRALHSTLSMEPISLMLTDADGLVINRLCGDSSLTRDLDAVHLAPGFSFSEREAGTNGLALALADRVPTLVRAEEHYVLSLCTYTCAAVPVWDPHLGRLEGSINLTMWSRQSSDLLLALAQSAAANTTALMLARSRGRSSRTAPRGEVFRVAAVRLEPGSGTARALSSAWQGAFDQAHAAMRDGRVVAAVGEPGSGRTTVLAQAERQTRPRGRILAVSPPSPQDAAAWLSLWTPELGKPHTSVIVGDVDMLPTWVAEQLRDLLLKVRAQQLEGPEATTASVPLSVTAERFEDIPGPLAALVDTVIGVPPLRDRQEDVLPLALHFASQARGRQVDFTAAARHALTGCAWPGNAEQLRRVVTSAARRTELIGIQHLPAEVLSDSTHHLPRIRAFEREEIVRVVTRPGATMRRAADELGMSRATLYRKVSQYGIRLPREEGRPG